MPQFSYKGRDAGGHMQQGRLEAESPDDAAGALMGQGITPLEISQLGGGRAKKNAGDDGGFLALLSKDIIEEKVKLEDLIALCRQMLTLTKAGVTLIDSLKHVGGTTRSKPLRNALFEVATHISSGKTLTAGFSHFPKIFPSLFISIVDAGERSGSLETSFEHLSEYLAMELATRKRIQSATRYPKLVAVAMVAALVVINFMVIPTFAKMFERFGNELPLMTRIMIGLSDFMLENVLQIVVFIVASVFAIRYALGTSEGRYLWDRVKLKLPVYGMIMERIVLGRFARGFAMMLQTGVLLVDGITLVAKTVDNEYVMQTLFEMRDKIARGEGLGSAAKNSHLFPPLVMQMISVGEEAGAIDTLLNEVADYYEREVDYDLKRLSELIEPFLLVFMGGMVLVLALAVFMPMWDMVNFVR